MSTWAAVNNTRGRRSGRLRGRSRRVDDDDDDDADVQENINEDESSDNIAIQDNGQDSDESEYASSAGGEDPDDIDVSDVSDANSFASDVPRRAQRAPAARAVARHGIDTRDTSEEVDHRIPTYTDAARVVRTARGLYKRGDPQKHIARTIYGPGVLLFSEMCNRWTGPLPSDGRDDNNEASAAGGVLASPWLSEHFEDDQIDALRRWYNQCPSTAGVHLAAHSAGPYYPFEGTAYILPAGSDATRVLRPGECMGLPAEGDAAAIQQMVADLGGSVDGHAEADQVDEDDSFLLHAGGEICSVAWAPVGTPDVPQLLAIAVMPHKKSEAEADNDADANADAGLLDPQLQLQEDLGMGTGISDGQPVPGSIQLWSMALRDGKDRNPPRLDTVVCFDWGWPKRMAWCPVPLVYAAGELVDAGSASAAASRVYGMLAMLTDDGIVRVIEARVDSPLDASTRPAFVRTPPIAVLQIHDEPGAAATCLSWAGVHELVLGHADGSVTLWDIAPLHTAATATMLLRVPAHDDCVLDVCTAYPSHPYLVTSRPIQGVPRLVDLRRPATEHTYHPTPSVGFQPALLSWSDHLQGFVSTAATNNPVNGRLDFFPAMHFPLPLFLVPHTRASLPTCLSVAAVHPYLAVGRSDGSVCVVNMLKGMFRSARISKLTAELFYVFNSEWRAVPSKTGPAVGSLAVRTLNTLAYKGIPLGSLGLARHAASGDDTVFEDGDADTDAELDADATMSSAPSGGPSLMRIHDPQTRVASVAWNPNLEYGTWCAIGLASGLVSIKKLAPTPI